MKEVLEIEKRSVKHMKLRMPLFFFSVYIIYSFNDKLLLKWLHNSGLRTLIYGLLLFVAFFIIEKSGAANKKVSLPIGIFVMILGFLLIISITLIMD
ncbi:hypothetical protein MU1_40120 [Paenibacillus glycanilyticus]|uniref:Uncharacterized protein n=1 Tax=Paenibacillus glycanilyticus TaxID=126569 RepID=A0ABQ6GKV6_9BACL|nr:hypothetical protein MU1_40120 [Paenibacillus glycanilyticus]